MDARGWVARARMLSKSIKSYIDDNDMLCRSYSSSKLSVTLDKEVDLDTREEVDGELILGVGGSRIILPISAIRRESGWQ